MYMYVLLPILCIQIMSSDTYMYVYVLSAHIHQLILIVGSEDSGQVLEDVRREDIAPGINDTTDKRLRLLHIVQDLHSEANTHTHTHTHTRTLNARPSSHWGLMYATYMYYITHSHTPHDI